MSKMKQVGLAGLSIVISLLIAQPVLAAGIEATKTPTGFMALLTIIPLIIVLTLLFLKVDMIIAGLAGGIVAMIIGGVSLADANTQLLEAVPSMLSITVPIINSAVAVVAPWL